MAANKWVHETGKEFDVTPLHGHYVTINMTGQDVGYARVCVVSSNADYVLFRFRDKMGLAAKQFTTDLVELRVSERLKKREGEPLTEEWNEEEHPFARFVGLRCDIHMHQTRMFEATPGFFGAKVLYVDAQNNLIRIRDNSRQLNISIPMICGIMVSAM